MKPIVPLEDKRPRGRPRDPNALTPAERAKNYRERKKAKQEEVRDSKQALPEGQAHLLDRLIKLQMMLDVERQKSLSLEAELATLRQTVASPSQNPLARQVKALKKTVADQDRLISSLTAEIGKLRDERSSSLK